MNRHLRPPTIYDFYIDDYLNMRENLGYQTRHDRYDLHAFASFAHRKGHTTAAITKQLAEEWCGKRPNEAEKTWSNRNCCLRGFSTYLSNLGMESFIPSPVAYKRSNFTPYIFSDEQLQAIFNACDSLVMFDKRGNSALFVLPVLFRMLACTGIRINEAISLCKNDIVLEQKYLVLRHCKNGKDRIVPISESLTQVCQQYVQYRNLLPPNSNRFFVKMNGCACSSRGFVAWWNVILKRAGINYRGNIIGPRIHDLRHTFCIKSMVSLTKAGKDIYYVLPLLSTYIGHSSLAATDRYVRMTSEMYPELLSKTDSICSYIFPTMK